MHQLGMRALRCVMFCSGLFFLNLAQAYQSFIDTGDILTEGAYELTPQLQAAVDDIDGLNVGARFATALNPDTEVQAEIGSGALDFQIGGFFKYVPFPDLETQPAIGFRAGLTYAQDGGNDLVSLLAQPLVSKLFIIDEQKVTPYAVLSGGMASFEDESRFPLQMIIGSEWQPSDFKGRFYGEIGFNLSDSFSYLTIGAAFSFEDLGLM